MTKLPFEKFYEVSVALVGALHVKAAMHTRKVETGAPKAQLLRMDRRYHTDFDVCPVRGAWSDIWRAQEEVFWVMRDMDIQYANVTIEGTVYTIEKSGRVSPSPIKSQEIKP